MPKMSRAREKLLGEMRRAAARGHRIDLRSGTVKVGRTERPGVQAYCLCGWESRYRHSKSQALAAVAWHVGQVGQEDPLWDPVLGIDDTPDLEDLPRSVGGAL